MLQELLKELKSLADPERATHSQRYFKTGKGEYGEGDVFLGLNMGQQRQISKKYKEIDLADVQKLLNSDIHEQRMIGVLILVDKFSKSENGKEIFDFYVANAKRVNNWDLVDLSAPNIVGSYLLNKSKDILYKLAKSKNLWERRISIISTFAFIGRNELEDSLKLAEILLKDKHDLIHKAVGWVLREIGKRDEKVLEDFLKTHYEKIPRTTLRYAIERFEEGRRKNYLKGKF